MALYYCVDNQALCSLLPLLKPQQDVLVLSETVKQSPPLPELSVFILGENLTPAEFVALSESHSPFIYWN